MVVPPAIWRVFFPVQGMLTGVLDLADPVIQGGLGTSLYELTGDWRLMQSMGQMAPTQELGRLAYESGRIVALQYISTKNPEGGRNIVVFTDRLAVHPANRISVADPSTGLVHELP